MLNRAAHVLGDACQQQFQLSGRSKMADLWAAVVSRERCPLPDALAAWIPSLPSLLGFDCFWSCELKRKPIKMIRDGEITT